MTKPNPEEQSPVDVNFDSSRLSGESVNAEEQSITIFSLIF